MYFFGVIYLCTSIFIFFFKSEYSKNRREAEISDEPKDRRLSIFESYKVIMGLFKLKAVRELSFILLTANVDDLCTLYSSNFAVYVQTILTFSR
jgi:hypothetical protein